MKNIKRDLFEIMDAAERRFTATATEAGKIYGNRDLTDEAKLSRSSALAAELDAAVERLHEQGKQAKKRAAADIELAKQFNSDRRLINPDYQDSVIRTSDFIMNMPDTLGQSAISKRLWPFYGDDMAREYLSAVAKGISDSRKARGVEGFSINELFPDVYALQNAALDKVTAEIDDTLSRTLRNFTTITKSDAEIAGNDKAMLFMGGIFTGIKDYFETIPAELLRPATVKGIDYETIPCYAATQEDLDINFAMYRKP